MHTLQNILNMHFILHAAPPPDNVHLAQVGKNALTFQWDPVQSVCPDSIIGYKVIAANCGVCPNMTLSTSVTCTTSGMLTTNISTLCTLSVETTTCGTSTGNKSKINAATAAFKGTYIHDHDTGARHVGMQCTCACIH